MKSITAEQKLEVLQNPVVRKVLYDILHKRRAKYSTADNAGQHIDYLVMVDDLEKDYKEQINNSKTSK